MIKVGFCRTCGRRFKKVRASDANCPNHIRVWNYSPIKCEECGEETKRTSTRQRYCKICSDKRQKELANSLRRRRAEKMGKRLGWFNCSDCGIETKRSSSRGSGYRKYCKPCGWKRVIAYRCMASHYNNIIRLARLGQQRPGYVGMPFYDGWNPDKGGSFLAGQQWLIENLFPKPEEATLHIKDHIKGFVPDNLEWSHPRKQNAEQMFKIITEQRARIRELEDELNRYKQ